MAKYHSGMELIIKNSTPSLLIYKGFRLRFKLLQTAVRCLRLPVLSPVVVGHNDLAIAKKDQKRVYPASVKVLFPHSNIH